MPDFREGLDGLLGDMAAHQARYGNGQPTAEANRALAIPEIERMEREASERPTIAAPSVDDHEEIPPDLDVKPDNTPFLRPVEDRTARLMRRMMLRVDLLREKRDTGALGQASWSQRLDAVLYWRMKSARLWKAGHRAEANDLERRYMFELKQLLDESNASFGEWNADPAPLVMVGV